MLPDIGGRQLENEKRSLKSALGLTFVAILLNIVIGTILGIIGRMYDDNKKKQEENFLPYRLESVDFPRRKHR